MDFNFPKRFRQSNKGSYGRVLNVAGSKYMRGAAYLSSVSALKVGCGYLVICSCEEVLSALTVQLPEAVLAPIEQLEEQIGLADVVEIGCGLSISNEAKDLLIKVLSIAQHKAVVIDADGLNLLSTLQNVVLPKNLVLTPHPKEAARLLGISLEDVLKDMEYCAKEISKRYNCVTVLKSHETLVCSKDFEIYRNTTGNSALAKSGSGDVLCGMIAGFLAQKVDSFEAAKLAVYLHGLSADIAKNDLTEYGVLASDLVRYIPYSIKRFVD